MNVNDFFRNKLSLYLSPIFAIIIADISLLIYFLFYYRTLDNFLHVGKSVSSETFIFFGASVFLLFLNVIFILISVLILFFKNKQNDYEKFND